jgi:hypothetical protein
VGSEETNDLLNVIREKINSGEYSTKLSQQKHKRHVEGTKEFIVYTHKRETMGMSRPSKLYLSYEEAQDLILQYAGTGKIKKDAKGNALSQEYVQMNKTIGAYEELGEYLDTQTGMIKYGKYNAHLIPIKPK